MKSMFSLRNFLFIIVTLTSLFLINDSTSIIRRMYPLRYEEIVMKNAEKYDLDPHLIFALIKAESSFKPEARSKRGAKGLMQIMDKTACWAVDHMEIDDFDVLDLYDPQINIAIGSWYLSWLNEQFGSNTDMMLAAYNAGNGNVMEWVSSAKELDIQSIPYKETRVFVNRVKEFHYVYEKLYEN